MLWQYLKERNVYYHQVLGTSIIEYLVPAGLGREKLAPRAVPKT